MTGRPKLREFVRRLEEASAAAGHETPMDYVLERIANGDSLSKIALEVGNMSRWTLYLWIKQDEERLRIYEHAREVGAAALVDQAQEILDTADVKNPAAVMSARNRAAFRQWQAAMQDRKTFGRPTAPATQVNLSIGALHLDVLRKHGGPVLNGNGNGHPALPAPSLGDLAEPEP